MKNLNNLFQVLYNIDNEKSALKRNEMLSVIRDQFEDDEMVRNLLYRIDNESNALKRNFMLAALRNHIEKVA